MSILSIPIHGHWWDPRDVTCCGQAQPSYSTGTPSVTAPIMGHTMNVPMYIFRPVDTSITAWVPSRQGEVVLSLMKPHHVPECSETHSGNDNSQEGHIAFDAPASAVYCPRTANSVRWAW